MEQSLTPLHVEPGAVFAALAETYETTALKKT